MIERAIAISNRWPDVPTGQHETTLATSAVAG